jgi:hypothetical protein
MTSQNDYSPPLMAIAAHPTDFAASPECLNNDQTPPLMSTATHPTAILTLLLPLNSFTITMLLL